MHAGLDPLVRIGQLCLHGEAATDPLYHAGEAMHTAVLVTAAVLIRDPAGRRSVALAGALPGLLPDLKGELAGCTRRARGVTLMCRWVTF